MVAAVKPWMPFENPLDDSLFDGDSDVDWVTGGYVYHGRHLGRFYEANPWVPEDIRLAARIVKTVDTYPLLCALMSWRSVTVGQLQAGLCNQRVPVFDWTAPSVYGGLLRLGLVDIGFPRSYRWGHVQPRDVFLRMSMGRGRVRRWLRLLGKPMWVAGLLSDSGERALHAYARHNMFADHVGLTAIRDARVLCAAGDGWCAFRLLDERARGESGVALGATGDVLIVLKTGVCVVVEVQSSIAGVEGKVSRWERFLQASPFARRGIICVWLGIPSPREQGSYARIGSVLAEHAGDPLMLAGDVPLNRRMGYARWDEWYEPDGLPAARWGVYRDATGMPMSVFDEGLGEAAPSPRPLDRVRNWGEGLVRAELERVYQEPMLPYCRIPGKLAGGFQGLTMPVMDRSGQ